MNRYERRANEAYYRKLYGKAAFLKLRKERDDMIKKSRKTEQKKDDKSEH
jgi:hypothetical protein